MSKIIISHDVDHLSSYEHFNDLIIPKFVVRALIEKTKGNISFNELVLRYKDTIKGKWNFVCELSDFDKQNNITSNFFFATENGIGLAYDAHKAKPYFDYVLKAGHRIGIHGIARDSLNQMIAEKNRFQEVYGKTCIGNRLHYLFPDTSILPKISKAGYLYDSSLRGDGSTTIINNIVHFPVHIMDSDVFSKGYIYTRALSETKKRISLLIDNNTDYISLLFHDRYFSDAHSAWRDWYVAIIEWINKEKIAITTYDDAILLINSNLSNNKI